MEAIMEVHLDIGSANPTEDANEDASEKAKQAALALMERAGVLELAPGAAVQGELGWHLRTRLLGDQLAASHGVMMKLARRANYAINNANCMGGGEWAFDAEAARIADMAGRMIDRYRRGLEALDRLGRPEGEPEIWQGLYWPNDPLAEPEELQRRIAAARAVMNRNRPKEPTLSQAAQEFLARARTEARRLTVVAGVEALTADGVSVSRPRLFVDQLAVAHHMMMRLAGRADWQLTSVDADKVDAARQERALNRLTGAMGRMMDRYRRGLLTLKRQECDPDGGPAKVTGTYWAGSSVGYQRPSPEELAAGSNLVDPAAASLGDGAVGRAPLRVPSDPVDSAHGSAIGRAMADPGARRGQLRHGNPSGDYLKAPRCGAGTRAGACCGQPAMANGRCRFHGGKSTGPRGAAGLARVRAARLRHGGRSAEVIELRAAAAAIGRNIRWLTAGPLGASPTARRHRPSGSNAIVAGHGVDRRDFVSTAAAARRSRRASTARRPRAIGHGPIVAGAGGPG
jgi:hypothetical protein